MALKPLHDAFQIKRVIVSTYQSVTGTGMHAVQQLENEKAGIDGPSVSTLYMKTHYHIVMFLKKMATPKRR